MSEKKTIVISPEELAKSYLKACRILEKLRFYRSRFEQNHDSVTKKQMKFWEVKADEFLLSLTTEDEVDDGNLIFDDEND